MIQCIRILSIISTIGIVMLSCNKDTPIYQGTPKVECSLNDHPLKFCTLDLLGTDTSCSKCHPGEGGFDIQSFSEVRKRVIPGNAEASTLHNYLLDHGKMHTFASEPLKNGIKNWILEGANP